MNTAEVAAGMRQVRDLMRTWGYAVEEVPGWERRGSGTFTAVIGQADHHDAFPASLGPARGLRTCTFGRRDLRNSLCMFYLASDAVTYLVAAKPSWHTGRAAWRGRSWPNSRVSGIEAANDGVGEPWPAAMIDAYDALNAATAIVFGFTAAEVADHKEIAVPRGRKIDRTGIHPPTRRARIAEIIAGADPTTTSPFEEDEMRRGHPDAAQVKVLQWRLAALGYDLGKSGDDGDYGPATEAAVKAFQADHGYRQSGVMDAFTYTRLSELVAAQNLRAALGRVQAKAGGISRTDVEAILDDELDGLKVVRR